MQYLKGSTIATLRPLKVIPYFDLCNDDNDRGWEKLPHYKDHSKCSTHFAMTQEENIPPETISIIRKQGVGMVDNIVQRWVIFPAIVMTLHLLDDTTLLDAVNHATSLPNNNQHWNMEALGQNQFVQQTWELVVRDRTRWEAWLLLLARITPLVHLVESTTHPLNEYAMQQVPHLTLTELQIVCDILKLPIRQRNVSVLVVQKLILDQLQDNFHRPSCVVLFSPHSPNQIYPHSCLPTAQLELSDNGTIVVTALYDIPENGVVTINHIRDASVEERDSALQIRLGYSCTCLRCRYELADDCPSVLTPQDDVTSLARYYMVTGDLDQAKQLYTVALKQQQTNSNNAMVVADLYHVLGAIELANKKFLKAQRVWKNVVIDTEHKEISLQMDKMKAYEYFVRCERSPTNLTAWEHLHSSVPGAFLTRVLDNATCQQVIQWVEQNGKWTQQRHYAVPTVDIPVHSVPKLQQWFQHHFMKPVMQRVLSHYFQTNEGRFYVHDAFCVRYSAGSSSHYLPIRKLVRMFWLLAKKSYFVIEKGRATLTHIPPSAYSTDTDESTHSFILALNDDFTGGGTYFFDHDTTVKPPKGCTLCFSGGTMLHGGEAVLRGTRYILAVFLYFDIDKDSLPESQNSKRESLTRGVNDSFRDAKQRKTVPFSFDFEIAK